VLLAIALALIVPAGDATLGETTDLLPADSPVHQALDQLSKYFGEKSALSSAVFVFERRDAVLNANDLADIEHLGSEIKKALPGETLPAEMNSVSIRTPATFALAGKGNPLISDDGHAALVWVTLPYNFVTKSSAKVVKHLHDVLARQTLPDGVSAAITGSAGYGYDYDVATERSVQKTQRVTLISVIIILLVVYRAPIAALVPLGAIGIAAGVTSQLLTSMDGLGIHGGSAEKIFTFVLLYGAGVDYSLLFMSRYREFLDAGKSSADAISAALGASIPAIASSAAMTISGLAMLCFAHFSVFRNSGPAVVLSITVAATAAMTLVPAIIAIIGPVAYWPAVRTGRPKHQPIVWPAIARIVSHRPWTVMIIMLIGLGIPAIKGSMIQWNYDALTSLKPGYQARTGAEMVEKHWPTGEIAPVTLLLSTDTPRSDAQWKQTSAKIADVLYSIGDIDNIRCFDAPLGRHIGREQNVAMQLIAGSQIKNEFVSSDHRAMRLIVVLKLPPLTRQAMSDVSAIAELTSRFLHPLDLPNLRVYTTGATAEMIDLREITQRDFHRIALLAMGAILLVVFLTLGDFPVAFFILAATALSYLTTLGLSCWIFELLGNHGLEWKVQMLLFIVLIAVGQDYSIFFAVRLAQEARELPCKEATKKALIFTGPVISSCGLIMAATLGSVMAGDVTLLVQLGFAFALGMLLDTFIVRPLLLPSLILISGRTLPKAVVGNFH
jgi:RND superfamily putative drug exporter